MRTQLILSAILCVACNLPTLACSVPVFRYALENWEPDRLTVAVLHSGDISDATQAQLSRMTLAAEEAEDRVNLQLHPIDIAAQHAEESAEAYLAKQWKDQTLPHMLVYFTNNAPQPQLAWSAELNETNVEALLDSPARRQLTERLLDGQSAVWILLKSGNAEADRRAEETLQTELAKKPNEIELPSLTDLATEEKFDETLSVEMRVEFSLIAIESDDPRELFFREMLLNTEDDLKEFDEPVAIPIYGRGRTYFALVGPGITPDNIADNCNFICGACSCEVKRDNPGQDLLLAANWNQVQPGNWVNDTPLPELTGIGGFESLENQNQTVVSRSELEEAAEAVESDPQQLVAALDSPSSSPHVAATNAAGTSGDSLGAAIAPARTEVVDVDQTVPTLILVGWGSALLLVGIVFTLWHRRRTTDS